MTPMKGKYTRIYPPHLVNPLEFCECPLCREHKLRHLEVELKDWHITSIGNRLKELKWSR